MALDTYANLQTAILNVLMRPADALLTPLVPDWITLFEASAKRRLRTYWQETSTTVPTVAGTAYISLPADYGSLRNLRLETNPVVRPYYVTPAQFDDYFALATSQQPEAFTLRGSKIYFGPTPDAVYTVTLDYMQGLPALSGGVNWLLTNHPDAYLFGSLAEGELYIGDDPRFPIWKSRRDEVFQEIFLDSEAKLYPGGALQMKTDTGNP